MRLRGVLLGLTLALLAPFIAPHPVYAADTAPRSQGLLITPVRNYVSVDAGSTVTRSFTVANRTEKPMVVRAGIEEFSVVDVTYDFRFSTVKNDWLNLVENQVTLKPFESKQLPYRIAVPKGAAAGGQYFSLYASAQFSDSQGVKETVRAASLLYLTVNGPLNRSSQITGSSLPWVAILPTIPYRIDIKNTGNVHYFAYVSARVDSLFYKNTPTGASILLMPGTTRKVSASVPSPLLPGIYKVTYGYKPDAGSRVDRVGYVLYAPPWFIVALIILGFAGYRVWQRRKKPSDS